MSTHESPDSEWQRLWSHREALLKVARSRSASPEDAEDAVQEAMVRAAENPNVDRDRLGAWLTSVTVRLCVDRHRQLRRDEAVSARAHTVLTSAPSGSPEDTVCDRAEARWLALQSRSLPRRQAEALKLKAQNLDVAQVARHMGLTYKATESLLGRARQTLRAVLASTLALVLGLWRGRPRTNGGTSAAAPATTLVSAGAAVVLAGLVLVTPAEAERPAMPESPLSGPADSVSSSGLGYEDQGAEPGAIPGTPVIETRLVTPAGAGVTPSAVPATPMTGTTPPTGATEPTGPSLPATPAADLPTLLEPPATTLPPLPGVPALLPPVEASVPPLPGTAVPAAMTP
ncbi:sigma-70 family RNA polymerase sigma factor [Streptomyces sp. DG1A-41]|uniref:RNA polymerase sigma factor n=1 Tax=Streptomyces sp. DG1A-41 TaxID=3125779 RepID=UPI0030CFA2C6